MDNKTKVTFFGHAMFLVESTDGTKIGLDPYNQQVKDDLPEVSADIVLESHDHFDHSNTSLFKGNPEVITKPDEKTVRNIEISGISTFHDDTSGKKRGKNTIFKFKVDNILFAHLGDLGHLLNDEQYRQLNSVNVLMLPVGGIYTIDYRRAMDVISRVKPNIAIPMHFKQDDTKVDVDKVDKFLKQAKNYIEKGHTVEISKEALPKQTEIWLLKSS